MRISITLCFMMCVKILSSHWHEMINFFEYRYLLLMSAQVMEMTEKEQSDSVYEVLSDIYMTIIKKKYNSIKKLQIM